MKNYNKISEDTVVDGSKIHALKMRKPIDRHFCFSLLGLHVLSMSKRIMNEVMCLAESIDCRIYYQDTDSCHVDAGRLPQLEAAYQAKYGRQLHGKHLGQFHSDFTYMNGRSDVKHGVESIFLMKKVYIDCLLLSDNTIDYMFRGKGLTQASILAKARDFATDDDPTGLPSLYHHLFSGAEVTFDLCAGSPAFKMNADLTVTTLSSFYRRIKTSLSEGQD